MSVSAAAPRRLGVGVRLAVALVAAICTALPLAATSAGAATSQFNDTPPSNAFFGDITWLVDQHITVGYPDGGFHPNATVLRQEMAAFLYRFKNHASFPPCTGTRPFPDVATTSVFCGAITWLASTGVTSGYTDGNFHPLAPVSREAMAQFMYRLTNPNTTPAQCTRAPFPDVPAQSIFCPAIAWLVGQGVVNGNLDGRFAPTAAVSREQMAAFLHRLAHPAPPTSISHYLRTGNAAVAAAAGQADGAADAAAAGPHLHLLDIGAQVIDGVPSPGVWLSATTNTRLTYAQLDALIEAYLDGYATAAPGVSAQIAVGTNSDGEFTKYPAATKGADWANDVVDPLRAYVATKGYSNLAVTGANDIEAGFSATEAQAQQWETAYLAATSAPLVYNGSADGCPYTYSATGRSCNQGWTEQQYYGLAGGNSAHRITVLPQIYNAAQAVQWANIDATGGGHLAFAGTLTELQACQQAGSCSSFTPEQAWIALWNALTAQGYQAALPATTDLMINK